VCVCVCMCACVVVCVYICVWVCVREVGQYICTGDMHMHMYGGK